MSKFEENIMKTIIMNISLCLFLVTVFNLKALPMIFSKTNGMLWVQYFAAIVKT